MGLCVRTEMKYFEWMTENGVQHSNTVVNVVVVSIIYIKN